MQKRPSIFFEKIRPKAFFINYMLLEIDLLGFRMSLRPTACTHEDPLGSLKTSLR
jgi:hypothetical protein